MLKLHAPGTDRSELDFQDAARDRARRHAACSPAAPRGPASSSRACSSWVDGTPWAEAGPWEPELLRELGRTVARIDRALAAVDHPAKRRTHRWNMLRGAAD